MRSRNVFAKQLNYNLLFRWFLDMDLTEPGFDDSAFSKNQERLLRDAVANQFFHEVVAHARLKLPCSDWFPPCWPKPAPNGKPEKFT